MKKYKLKAGFSKNKYLFNFFFFFYFFDKRFLIKDFAIKESFFLKLYININLIVTPFLFSLNYYLTRLFINFYSFLSL